jgi:hypothetical protein
VALTTQTLYLVRARNTQNTWWRAGAAYIALLPFLGPAVWEGYPGAVTRIVLPLTFAFNVQLVSASRGFWVLWLLGNVNILSSFAVLDIAYFMRIA